MNGRFEGGCDTRDSSDYDIDCQGMLHLTHLEIVVYIGVDSFRYPHPKLERRHREVDQMIKVGSKLQFFASIGRYPRPRLESAFNLDIESSVPFHKVVMVANRWRAIWSNTVKVSDLDLQVRQ